MSRWKPPSAPSSPYITRDGYRRLENELRELWARRSAIRDALSAAAAEGDRSENAEYIYRKKQLGEVDRRIRYLQKRLPVLNIVESVGDTASVFFGAWVMLENHAGARMEYRIVGGDEIDSDPDKGYISVDSPLARALLKKQTGDKVELRLPERTTVYRIVGIRYT